MLKRCIFSFCISSVCGLVVNLLIEIIVRMATGMEDFCTISPEFMAMFPSDTIGFAMNTLLYGVIGATFSIAMYIYELDHIGFVIQNILYCLATGVVWVPIVTLLWQLYRYPSALIGTLVGFAGSYVVMSIVAYRMTRKDVEQINEFLEQKAV